MNIDENDDEEEGGKGLSESIRRAVASGVSALFMTEEGIRNALSDMRLPKEALAYVVQQTDKTRRELFRAVTDEIKGFLKGIDLNREVRKALLGLKMQVNAEVRFVENGPPQVDVHTKIVDSEGEHEPPKRHGRRSRG